MNMFLFLSVEQSVEMAPAPVVDLEQSAAVEMAPAPVVDLEQSAAVEMAPAPVVELEQSAAVEMAPAPVVELEQSAAVEMAPAPVVELEQSTAVEMVLAPVVELEQSAALGLAQAPVVELEQSAAVGLAPVVGHRQMRISKDWSIVSEAENCSAATDSMSGPSVIATADGPVTLRQMQELLSPLLKQSESAASVIKTKGVSPSSLALENACSLEDIIAATKNVMSFTEMEQERECSVRIRCIVCHPTAANSGGHRGGKEQSLKHFDGRLYDGDRLLALRNSTSNIFR
jgi:hypothetical protein